MIVETFTRSASVFGGVIPANLGALEASNVAVVRALGLRRRRIAGAVAPRARTLLGGARPAALSARHAAASQLGSGTAR